MEGKIHGHLETGSGNEGFKSRQKVSFLTACYEREWPGRPKNTFFTNKIFTFVWKNIGILGPDLSPLADVVITIRNVNYA